MPQALRDPVTVGDRGPTVATARPRRWRAWWLALRPGTLTIAVAPVLVGSSLAWADTGGLDWPVAAAVLAGALTIQAGTNLVNDAADYLRGVDQPDRIGPKRATAEGWLGAAEVRRAALAAFGLAAAIGLYLVWQGGWPILALGLAAIAAGLGYSVGPKPIAFTGLGEVFVFAFFGLGAVLGSYYLQAGRITGPAVAAAAALGLLAAAVLTVNNYRDMATDLRAGRRTLAHRLGRRGTRGLYALEIALPFALATALAGWQAGAWLAVLALPWAAWLYRRFRSVPPGPVFNKLLVQTARLQLAFALLLSLGFLLQGVA